MTVAAPVELRCKSKMYGILREDGLLEVKCRHKWCADRTHEGVVVLHYFNVVTGELVKTVKYRNPKLNNNRGSQKPGSNL